MFVPIFMAFFQFQSVFVKILQNHVGIPSATGGYAPTPGRNPRSATGNEAIFCNNGNNLMKWHNIIYLATCGYPPNYNVRISNLPSSYHVDGRIPDGYTLNFYCLPGRTLHGSQHSTCKDSSWSNPDSYCRCE